MASGQTSNDYRRSHAGKGEDYDQFIEQTPLDAYMAGWEDRYLRAMLPSLFPGKTPRHLDFACGTGRIVATVAPYCRESIGVDISASMLEIARRKCPTVIFVEGDITSGRVDLGTPFDLITAFRFFGNAQDDLRIRVLRQLNRSLCQGGLLVLNSHRNPQAIKNILHRMTGGTDELDLDLPRLTQLLREHGFEVLRRRPIGFWLFRNGLAASERLKPDSGARLEALFSAGWLSRYAPDMIIVAKKVRDLA